MPALISSLSINFPTSSNKPFSFISISLSILLLPNLPSKDLLININVLFIKLPHLPSNSPLLELIKSFQVKLKSLFSNNTYTQLRLRDAHLFGIPSSKYLFVKRTAFSRQLYLLFSKITYIFLELR